MERGNPLGGTSESNPLPSIGPKLRELCIEASSKCRRLHVRERYASNAQHIFFTKEILEKSVSFNPKQVIAAFPFWASSDDVMLRANRMFLLLYHSQNKIGTVSVVLREYGSTHELDKLFTER